MAIYKFYAACMILKGKVVWKKNLQLVCIDVSFLQLLNKAFSCCLLH